MIAKDPGIIIGPITRLLGWIFNFVFNIVYSVVKDNALGISIIVITIFVRVLIWPLSIKQLANAKKMQKLQPQIKELREKYLAKNQNDPEAQRNLNIEMQKLYAENKINPTGGCLLAFIQLPIFMALNQLLACSYRYINIIGEAYRDIAQKIMGIKDYVLLIKPLAISKVPGKMQIDLSLLDDMQKVINSFGFNDWKKFLSGLDFSVRGQIKDLLIKKEGLEKFLGIDLVEPCGLKFPGLIIPILVVLVTFLSSYFMMKDTSQFQVEEAGKNQQKIMLLVMPLLMGFLTLNLSSGVGIYWITSSVFQLVQQFYVNSDDENF